jgi:hypothetical protein
MFEREEQRPSRLHSNKHGNRVAASSLLSDRRRLLITGSISFPDQYAGFWTDEEITTTGEACLNDWVTRKGEI